MKKICLLIVLIFVLCSCAGKPSYQQILNADYGEYPNNYEQIIKDYYSTRLFDPYSADFNFTKPNRRPNNIGSSVRYGYAVCGSVNAKNRFGGYVGSKPFFFLIKNGHVIEHYAHDSIFINVACKKQQIDAVEEAQAAMAKD